MKFIARALSVVFALTLLVGSAVGCGKSAGAPAPDAGLQKEKKLRIVTTIFPEYDWVRTILGERAQNAELTLLLDNGTDLHSYQPTVDDVVKISGCDLFLYVGGESDGWVEDVLSEKSNQNMVVINLLEALGDAVKEEEVVEGMQEEEEHHHDHEGGEDHGGDHEEAAHEEEEIEYDEHVWLSLRNAAVLCGVISERLGSIDPANRDAYAANAASYIKRLNALDARYSAAVKAGKTDTLLFGDRFPFRYLADDYGLNYYAAFSGCSAETEASFETILFLAGKVDELKLPAVLTIESGDGRIARTIVENTSAKNAAVLQMDSLQSSTSRDAENGATYLGVMEGNLNVLKQALKGAEA